MTVRMAPPHVTNRPPPVCPILTVAVLSPPSVLAPASQQSITTLPCLGPKCAFFHAAGACAVLVMSDALLAQAHMMADDQPKPDESTTEAPPNGTPQ